MSIKQELEKLKEIDVWSLLLFALFKVKDIPQYASLSELAYILDKKNLLKLLEYFGGTTIKIPTIDEMESLLYALLIYQYVDIEKIPIEDALLTLGVPSDKTKDYKLEYTKVKTVLNSYSFEPRQRI